MAGVRLSRGGTRGGIYVELRGAKTIAKNLRMTADQSRRMLAFLKNEGEKLSMRARKIVPVDTGRLRDSHRTEVMKVGGKSGTSVVAVAAGGISVRGRFVNYAAAVHEGFRHAKSKKRIAGRPWLETAFRAFAPGFLKRLARAVKIYGRRV